MDLPFNVSKVVCEGNYFTKRQIYNRFSFCLFELIVKYYQSVLKLDFQYQCLENGGFYLVQLKTPILQLPKTGLSEKQYLDLQENINDICSEFIHKMLYELIAINQLDDIKVFCVDVGRKNCFEFNGQIYLLDLNAFGFVGYREGAPVNLISNKQNKLIKYCENSPIDDVLVDIKEYIYTL